MIEPLNVPIGAMQFEVSPKMARVYTRTPVIWVLPPVPKRDYSLNGCNCKSVYPVVEELIPDKHKPALEANRQSRSPKGKFFVCDCYGKVIE